MKKIKLIDLSNIFKVFDADYASGEDVALIEHVDVNTKEGASFVIEALLLPDISRSHKEGESRIYFKKYKKLFRKSILRFFRTL